MPKAWSNKRERQYQHIKESEEERGKSEKLAKEIAARTVNKQRRQSHETPNERTQGTGNPSRSLEQRSRDELYNRARQLKIAGRSRMTKEQLVAAVRKAG
jgi:hypothetical protein